MNQASGKREPSVKSKEDDHPDERLRDLLEGRFPEGLPPSQSQKEKNLDDKKVRKPKKRGKK